MMVHGGHTQLLLLALVGALGLSACVGELGYVSSEPEPEAPPAPTVAYGGPSDLLLASDLALWLADRATWPAFSGLDGFQTVPPMTGAHGTTVRYRLNAVAAQHPDTLPSGSIVVVERYASPDASALVAVAAMQRVDGYDPARGDWFWAELDPALSVVKDDGGRPLAGRVGVGVAAGCSGCHASAPGDDWVYSNGPLR